MKKLLVVYNTCGIANREQPEQYIKYIHQILDQDFDDFHVVISGCLNDVEIKRSLDKEFGNHISYSWIEEVLTVNVTFNHTVRQFIKVYGECEGYIYVDSGISFGEDKQVLTKIYDLFQSGPYAMISGQTDNDNAFIPNLVAGSELLKENTIVPLGAAANLHTQLFSNELYHTFDHRLIPDVFASFCTESVFTFLCAAIQKSWIIHKDVILSHHKNMDGASAGFIDSPNFHPWDHTLDCVNRSMKDIIAKPEAIDSGFGYEECKGILNHNQSQYDENGYSINPLLKKFMLENIFLQSDEFNYDTIKHGFV